VNIIEGDLWSEEGRADIILVTTNAMSNAKGALVMGRGAALQAANRYPALPFDLSRRIAGRTAYGVVVVPPYGNDIQLGAFQVKYHWRETASRELVNLASTMLRHIALAFPDSRFALNYPGIGNGKLTESEVLPIIKRLPDNVYIYKLPQT
jgi:hypothetical protein